MSSEVDMIDLKARSREGRGLGQHAGDHWIEIQKNTFMNWVNLQLQGSGLMVKDFETDFDDGVRLCALVESLQNRKIGRVIKKPINQHQSLENVTLALRAIAEDNVRLVNIGSEDIVNGSLKLILGLVWHLILRYQIGKTKFPPKKLMLAWLKAVIPECEIGNFTSDWNDGVALHALIEYCKPGLCPDWRHLSRHDRLENCENAMTLARDQLNIPIVVRPEDFSSPHLDELSGMTYLSYYMMVDSPGYIATRREIRALLQQGTIENFTTDWNDGHLLCSLVKSVGGDVLGWPNLSKDHEHNLQNGIDGAKKLGIEPIFSAKEMADPEVEHLGIMAYAAYFRQFKPVKIVQNKATMEGNFNNIHIKQEKHFVVHAGDGTSHDAIRAEVIGPDSVVPVRTKWNGDRCDCYFTPTETGQHKLNVFCDGTNIPGCPVTFKVSSDKSKIKFDHLDHAVVGVTSDLKVDMASAGHADVQMLAVSPSGHTMDMPLAFRDGVHKANFTPTEVGDWRISMLSDGEHLSGSPYTVKVFDPSLVKITDLHSGTVGHELTFHADASAAGEGEVTCEVFHEGSRVPCYLRKDTHGKYTVDFTPQGSGRYEVHAYMNQVKIRGSPYSVDIIDSSRVTVTGDGLDLVPVNTPAAFNIHTHGAGGGKVDVDIVGPNGENVPFNISHEPNGDRLIKYTPTNIGDYTIHVKYSDHEVSGSPFIAKSYNTGAIVVSPIPDGFVNQPMYFSLDIFEAGEGQLQIMVNKGSTPNEVEAKGLGQYRVKFIPSEPGKQLVDILFNNEPLSCSPLTCHAQDLSANVAGLHHLIPVQTPSSFRIESQANIHNVATEVTITGPSGQSVPARIVPTSDGKGFNVEYTPREIGVHTVRASLAGVPLKGGTFNIQTFDPSHIKITQVKQGIVGVPCKFNVDASNAGDGTLEIAVNHNGQIVPNTAMTVGKHRYECSFIGQHPGNYRVTVTYNDVQVQGSPFTVNVIDVVGIRITGHSWNLVACNKKAGFNVVSPHGSFEDMNVRITDPGGLNVPCRLSERGDGTAQIDWHPSTIGTHKVYIDYAGVPIQGSPFTIKVFDSSRVKMSNILPGLVNRPVSFTLDASEAGDGNLEILVMRDEEIVPNYVQDEGNTMFKVTFTPKRAGLHQIHTQFNGEAVRGSPHQCPVLDPESVQVTGAGVEMATANVATSFHVNMKNAGEAKLNVRVISPFGEEIPVHVSGNARSGLRIDYTPYEVGMYKVFVECAGIPVKGSPFNCNVFDPALIRINAPGRAYFNKPVHMHLDSSAAGHGTLGIQVKCRGSEVPVRLRESASDRFDISFTPQNISPHIVNVFFNDLPVPGTPFEVPVIDSTSVSVSDDGLRLVKVYKEAGLSIEHQGLDERDLDITIVAPSGNTIPARLGHHGNNLRINFTPLEVGLHKIHVNVGDSPVAGSPFPCNVYNASAVRIIDVDKSPKKEREIGFTIDSSAAGAGTLEVQVTHKGHPVRAEYRKLADGQYHYTFKPLSVGRYEVRATFNGDIIPGSPLIIDVEEDTPTFIRINFSSNEPINAKGRNWFLLHMGGREVDRDMLNVMILGCAWP